MTPQTIDFAFHVAVLLLAIVLIAGGLAPAILLFHRLRRPSLPLAVATLPLERPSNDLAA